MDDSIYSDEQICAKCVDENEVIFDEQEDFMKKVQSVDIRCPEELNKEILKNLTKCSSVLLMFMKQRIIAKEPRVRYHPANDIYGLRGKILETGLSEEVRNFFHIMSEIGCSILQESGMLETLVELDSWRPGKVVAFGKTLKMVAHADILSFATKDPKSAHRSKEQKCEEPSSNEITEYSATDSSLSTSGIVNPSESKESLEKHKRPKSTAKIPKTKSETTRNADKNITNINTPTAENTESKGHKFDNNECSAHRRSKERTDSDEHKDMTDADQDERTDKAVITVAITARNHPSAFAVYKQLLLSYLQPLSKFYFLTLHIGPLVDKQELVLYEYIPSQKLIDLIKSFGGKTLNQEDQLAKEENEFVVSLTVKKSNSLKPTSIKEPINDQKYLDINELEKCFRDVNGSKLQKVAALKKYFKYLVNDCPGVKDHVEDKKNRYERYMAKREVKKQMERKSRKYSMGEDEHSMAGNC